MSPFNLHVLLQIMSTFLKTLQDLIEIGTLFGQHPSSAKISVSTCASFCENVGVEHSRRSVLIVQQRLLRFHGHEGRMVLWRDNDGVVVERVPA